MATNKTAGYQNSQAKALESGVNTLLCRVSLSATFSAGDIYYIGKLPHKAKIVSYSYLPGAAAAAAQVWHAGINGNSLSAEALFASASYGLAVAIGGVIGALGNRGAGQLSLSDERLVRYADVTFTPELASSVGHIGDIAINYVLDDAQ